MAGLGCLLIMIGMVVGLAPLLYELTIGPDLSRQEFTREYWPITVPAVVVIAIGVILVRVFGKRTPDA